MAWRSTVNHAWVARQPAIEASPALSGVAAAIDGRLAVQRSARPNGRAIHRKHPDLFCITRVRDDREADVADPLGHASADSNPAPRGPIKAIAAAMVLLIEAVGSLRMLDHAMRIVSVLGIRIGQKISFDAFIEGGPVGAAVIGLEHPAD